MIGRDICISEGMGKRRGIQVVLGLVVLLGGGCTVGPNYRTPTVETPTAYKEATDWKPAQPNDQNLGGNWWTIFKDPKLDELELQVNVSNVLSH